MGEHRFSLSCLSRLELDVHRPILSSLAWLEVRYPLFGYFYTVTSARVAPNSRRAMGNGKAAKTTNFNAMALRQGIGHAVEHGFYNHFDITVWQLVKLRG